VGEWATARRLLLAAVLAFGCGTTDLARVEPPSLPREAETTTPSGIRIVAVRTGWVGIKEPHWRYEPPALLVLPRLVLSRRWHPWLPNISYAIARDGRSLLVDTGADPAIESDDYMRCDPANRFFYRHEMRFRADPEDTIDRRLPELGVRAATLETIVITHFHGDHPGRLAAFPPTRVVTGPGNWPEHVGSVPRTMPPGFAPEIATFPDGPFGVFERSQRLLDGDDVRLVPLPGHTPGHVGVLVRDGARYWLVAGDATFTEEEARSGHVCGLSQDVELAGRTQDRIRRQLDEYDTVLLPAHDPAVFRRLRTTAQEDS